LLRSLYAIIAAPVFAVVLFLICCPLIVALPRLQWRRAMGRLSVRLSLGAIGVPIRVHGRQHLPQGPSVAVANHTSYLDGLVLTAALPGTFTFMVQDGAARWPVVGFVLRRMGVSFVNRTAVREGARQTRALLKRLAEGESLAIFAEGTFEDAPGLLPFKTGAFLLAARAGVPVTPVVIRGTRQLLGGGRRHLQWSPVGIEILTPHIAAASDRETVATLRDTVRARIAARCGEPDLARAAID
jgi:1-acyl-sn-glycerol-3-phosphate acyltransferase